MCLKNICIIFFILIGTIDATLAQTPTDKKDSTSLYKDIESYSNRSKFTKLFVSQRP